MAPDSNMVPEDSYLAFSVPPADAKDEESQITYGTITPPPIEQVKKPLTPMTAIAPQAESSKNNAERDLEAQTGSKRSKKSKMTWYEKLEHAMLKALLFIFLLSIIGYVLEFFVWILCNIIWPQRYPRTEPNCNAVSKPHLDGLWISVKCE